jgi:hypothetical protein
MYTAQLTANLTTQRANAPINSIYEIVFAQRSGTVGPVRMTHVGFGPSLSPHDAPCHSSVRC